MQTDGRIVQAVFVPRTEHAGFTHAVHGGILTTALDELMAWAIIVGTRRPAYSAEFTIRFLRPVLLAERTLVTGEMTGNKRNRLFEARGEIRNSRDQVCAVAQGKYLPMNAADAQAALQDFPEDLRAYFRESI